MRWKVDYFSCHNNRNYPCYNRNYPCYNFDYSPNNNLLWSITNYHLRAVLHFWNQFKKDINFWPGNIVNILKKMIITSSRGRVYLHVLNDYWLYSFWMKLFCEHCAYILLCYFQRGLKTAEMNKNFNHIHFHARQTHFKLFFFIIHRFIYQYKKDRNKK